MRSVAEINGAEPTPVVWTVLALVFLLLAVTIPVGVAWLRRRRERARMQLPGGEGIEPARLEYLAALDDIEAAWHAERATGVETLGEAARLVREFVGLATDTDVASLTLVELEDRAMVRPELSPVVEVVQQGYPQRFATGTIDPGEVAAAVATAREAVTRWR